MTTPTKPSRTRKILGAVLFKNAARDALRPARQGAEIISDMLDKIKQETNRDLSNDPAAQAADPAERFIIKCQQRRADKTKLMVMEKSLLRVKRVYLVFFYILPWLAIALLLSATNWMEMVPSVNIILFSIFALALAIRAGYQLHCVQHRRGWTWSEYTSLFPSKPAFINHILSWS